MRVPQPYDVVISSLAWREVGRMAASDFAALKRLVEQLREDGSAARDAWISLGGCRARLEVDHQRRRVSVAEIERTDPAE